MSRKLVVSNQDNRIRYKGHWSPTNSSLYQTLTTIGPSPPLESPLKEAISNSSFAFAFNGTSIDVLGLINYDSSDQDQVEFSCNCSIDGNIITPSISTEENNAPLCTTSILPSGSHELVVNISSKNTHFFLDNLQYVPLDDTLLDDATVIISNTDPSISYSPEWIQVPDFAANMTNITGASVNISFIGHRIGWSGVILASEPQHAHSLAQYSIDHGPMVDFNLSGPSSSINNTIPNVRFFTTGPLKQGLHTLHVHFMSPGNDSTIPLTLNNLVVTNGSDSTSSSDSSISFTTSTTSFTASATSFAASTTSSSSTTQFDDKRGSTVGSVIGVVVGAIVGLTFMVLLFIYCRRLKRRKLQAVLNAITPFQMEYTYSSASHSPAPLTREPGPPNDNSTFRRTYETTTDAFTRSNYVSLQREKSQSSNSSTATSSSYETTSITSSTSSGTTNPSM